MRALGYVAAAPLALVALFLAVYYTAEGFIYLSAWILMRMI